ncbi:MAG TPA: 4-alpha-glucanotransferase [Bacteroidales bacterium]|nr:4-alpha-glucanotransferase [Bacteroidales bacterium]
MPIKTLMFGWEFPPHITGGLGTACKGLTRGLAQCGTEVIFVIPKAFGDEDTDTQSIVGANNVRIRTKSFFNEFSQLSNEEEHTEEFNIWKELTYIEVGSVMVPYLTPEEFHEYIRSKENISKSFSFKSVKDFWLAKEQQLSAEGTLSFSGKYGTNLMEEVSNYAIAAAVIAQQHKFDVIHAHDWLTYPAGVAAKKISGKPLVIHVHATEFDRSGENVNTQVFDIEKMGMQMADRIIAVSNLTRNIIIERYGINAEKVTTVYNAVEPDQMAQREYSKSVDDKIVTFLGRITFQKGPEYFIKAAAKVLKRMPNVRFVMAGSGDMMNDMIMHAAALKISDKFHFTGFLKGDDVARMFGQSDVYVMPSVSEPFGISPLEAMRSSVPVIISKQSGVSEILQHAIKVDFWDDDAIADAIYGLLNYNGLSATFKHYGKIEVENLKWENAALQVNEVYKLAMN